MHRIKLRSGEVVHVNVVGYNEGVLNLDIHHSDNYVITDEDAKYVRDIITSALDRIVSEVKDVK